MFYTLKAKGTKKLKRLLGKIIKKLSKQSQLWKSRLKPKPTRRKPIVKLSNKEQQELNTQLRIDDTVNRHQMLGAVIALSLLAFTFVPLVPETYVTKIMLPGQDENYPNATDSVVIDFPDYTVDSSAADYEDDMIININNYSFPYRNIDQIKKEVKRIEGIAKDKINEKKENIIEKVIPNTPKKAKRFALFQIVKLLLGIPIVPGS